MIRLGASSKVADIDNEVKAITELCSHPNIITVFQYGKLDMTSYYYIDMELCAFSLAEYINKSAAPVESRSTTFEVWNIMSQLISGVQFIHSMGEVHRDLKPQNGNQLSIP